MYQFIYKNVLFEPYTVAF